MASSTASQVPTYAITSGVQRVTVFDRDEDSLFSDEEPPEVSEPHYDALLSGILKILTADNMQLGPNNADDGYFAWLSFGVLIHELRRDPKLKEIISQYRDVVQLLMMVHDRACGTGLLHLGRIEGGPFDAFPPCPWFEIEHYLKSLQREVPDWKHRSWVRGSLLRFGLSCVAEAPPAMLFYPTNAVKVEEIKKTGELQVRNQDAPFVRMVADQERRYKKYIFGNATPGGGSLFGQAATNANTGGLFGSAQSGGALFGGGKDAGESASGGLFGNVKDRMDDQARELKDRSDEYSDTPLGYRPELLPKTGDDLVLLISDKVAGSQTLYECSRGGIYFTRKVVHQAIVGVVPLSVFNENRTRWSLLNRDGVMEDIREKGGSTWDYGIVKGSVKPTAEETAEEVRREEAHRASLVAARQQRQEAARLQQQQREQQEEVPLLLSREKCAAALKMIREMEARQRSRSRGRGENLPGRSVPQPITRRADCPAPLFCLLRRDQMRQLTDNGETWHEIDCRKENPFTTMCCLKGIKEVLSLFTGPDDNGSHDNGHPRPFSYVVLVVGPEICDAGGLYKNSSTYEAKKVSNRSIQGFVEIDSFVQIYPKLCGLEDNKLAYYDILAEMRKVGTFWWGFQGGELVLKGRDITVSFGGL